VPRRVASSSPIPRAWPAASACWGWGRAVCEACQGLAAGRDPAARRLAGNRVLGACIRCGLCVRDCPFDILHLAKPEEPMSTGTPYFVARQLPCEMCEDIPCVKACPTGALDHSLKDINKSKMGLAVLVDHETCLNFLGCAATSATASAR
jgi:MauM/NapG family ferredoxin protein